MILIYGKFVGHGYSKMKSYFNAENRLVKRYTIRRGTPSEYKNKEVFYYINTKTGFTQLNQNPNSKDSLNTIGATDYDLRGNKIKDYIWGDESSVTAAWTYNDRRQLLTAMQKDVYYEKAILSGNGKYPVKGYGKLLTLHQNLDTLTYNTDGNLSTGLAYYDDKLTMVIKWYYKKFD
ncbi:hypothetical protein [uncultured Mucilaginibacter sp.]|nr:hypothetical protein [uncultured Mucilaginibacter sp.]